MTHFVTKCRACDAVLVQCRCASPNKEVRYVDGPCSRCRKSPVKDALEGPTMIEAFRQKCRGEIAEALRVRLEGRRALYLNTAAAHPDLDARSRMRERANTIDLVLLDLETIERNP